MIYDKKREFESGLKTGFPICLGYFPVSFTFGVMVANAGMPVWLAVLMSLSNVTSSGQFAGANLIFAGAGYFEICLTTFIINVRYMLMSLSLSQKLAPHTTTRQRLLFGFGITDEVFAFASVRPKEVTSHYMYGLISTPILGWALGTLCGALASNLLPASWQVAMGIALYAMFIAILVPAARESRPIICVILLSIGITCMIRYIPALSFISTGFRTILATILSAGICAVLFTKEENA